MGSITNIASFKVNQQMKHLCVSLFCSVFKSIHREKYKKNYIWFERIFLYTKLNLIGLDMSRFFFFFLFHHQFFLSFVFAASLSCMWNVVIQCRIMFLVIKWKGIRRINDVGWLFSSYRFTSMGKKIYCLQPARKKRRYVSKMLVTQSDF